MTTNGKHGSVQEMLPLEEIVEGVLCLRGGEYRAVIQAQSVNFALKSDAEQEAVMAAYRSFLNSLSHPVQMLVRILPTNVEPYLAGFRTNVTSHANSEAIRRLALDHEMFVRRLARERTLLERRFYLVVPVERVTLLQRNDPAFDSTMAEELAENESRVFVARDIRLDFIAKGLAPLGYRFVPELRVERYVMGRVEKLP